MEFHIGKHWIVNLFGLDVHMDTLITLWITMAIVIFFALLAVGTIKLIPSRLQAVFENTRAGFGRTNGYLLVLLDTTG